MTPFQSPFLVPAPTATESEPIRRTFAKAPRGHNTPQGHNTPRGHDTARYLQNQKRPRSPARPLTLIGLPLYRKILVALRHRQRLTTTASHHTAKCQQAADQRVGAGLGDSLNRYRIRDGINSVVAWTIIYRHG